MWLSPLGFHHAFSRSLPQQLNRMLDYVIGSKIFFLSKAPLLNSRVIMNNEESGQILDSRLDSFSEFSPEQVTKLKQQYSVETVGEFLAITKGFMPEKLRALTEGIPGLELSDLPLVLQMSILFSPQQINHLINDFRNDSTEIPPTGLLNEPEAKE